MPSVTACKRAVRMLTAGVMTMGDAPLPVRPYDDDGGHPHTGRRTGGAPVADERKQKRPRS